ncbi:MAG: hypothetical protein E7346_03355 [Clostridiales bacterium]|nr:hypothetical protein [Clostridiales bacterium]
MSNSETEKRKSIIDKIKTNKKLQYVIVVVLALAALCIFLSSFYKKDDAVLKESNLNTYVEELENRLSKTLSTVDGAGKVSVIITVESGMETVLAMETITKETSSGTEIIETPILVNGKTVVLKELYPEITGVVIVAEGAGSIAVLSKIQQATVSLLDIDVNQIEILTMKK